jgi:hypothetical protein
MPSKLYSDLAATTTRLRLPVTSQTDLDTFIHFDPISHRLFAAVISRTSPF